MPTVEVVSRPFVVSSVMVGLSSKFTEDEDREWLARAAGWLLVVGTGWLLLAAVSIYGPKIEHLLASAIASTGCGWALSLLGKSSKSPANFKDSVAKSWASAAWERARS